MYGVMQGNVGRGSLPLMANFPPAGRRVAATVAWLEDRIESRIVGEEKSREVGYDERRRVE